MNRRKPIYVLAFLAILVFASAGHYDDAGTYIIYTPQNTPISGGNVVLKWVGDDMSESEISSANAYYAQNYPYATRVADPTYTYNCHAFAWWVNYGGEKLWLNYPTLFMSDGSFESCSSYSATHVYYPTGGHSAVMTTAPYYVKSKWGSLGLYYIG
ncbi:MAG: hypothetical protein LIO90_07285 [Bacteroidales bacterium]|nr:hypothetical protein [Bacteroidales bacterium]